MPAPPLPTTALCLALAVVSAGTAAPPPAPSPHPVARWSWPLSPQPTVVRGFDAPAGPYAAGHRGVDLVASVGTSVTAVEAGTVTHAGTVAGRGTVTVRHADGLSSTYEPVAAVVGDGERVARGAVLGTLAPGGHCPTPCLHLGARTGSSAGGGTPIYRDPLVLLRRTEVVLLPL